MPNRKGRLITVLLVLIVMMLPTTARPQASGEQQPTMYRMSLGLWLTLPKSEQGAAIAAILDTLAVLAPKESPLYSCFAVGGALSKGMFDSERIAQSFRERPPGRPEDSIARYVYLIAVLVCR